MFITPMVININLLINNIYTWQIIPLFSRGSGIINTYNTPTTITTIILLIK